MTISLKKTRDKTRIVGRPFQPGNKAAIGNKGGGRPPEWFKAKMAELATSDAAIEFLSNGIKGDPVDEFLVLQTGVQVPVKCDGDLRLKMIQHCADRGYGKAQQSIEYSGESQILLVRAAEVK